MVLCLKTRESRSLPDLQRTRQALFTDKHERGALKSAAFVFEDNANGEWRMANEETTLRPIRLSQLATRQN